jgi:hypothetical protein
MRTTVVQSVEISTLKTSAPLPIQIRMRRSTSGQAVRLRNAIASPSQTSAVDRRCWVVSAKSVTAPTTIRQSRAHRLDNTRSTSKTRCWRALGRLA